jgi:DDE superfamily endonuclease
MTHDYKRNGTTTLFAAMSVLDGKVVGQCQPRHRHQEFLKFLRLPDREFPGKRELHLILDNYGTHKTPEVQAWLKKHRRFVPHFIPTSSSWLNLVREVVRSVDTKSLAARNIPQRLRPAGSDSILPGCVERQSQTIRLDRQSGRHS